MRKHRKIAAPDPVEYYDKEIITEASNLMQTYLGSRMRSDDGKYVSFADDAITIFDGSKRSVPAMPINEYITR